MTKIEPQDVIDLGAASAETKGMQTQFQADDALQHKPNPGLSHD
ncbi:benenodin family lasso peptide [Asticcacaulis sp. AC466]|nr:benenodin family lasso peptide [Asticcacaulis sp. AC466]